MTAERLATLAFIRFASAVTIGDLCRNQGLMYGTAAYRLRRCKQAGLVKSEADKTAKVRPGHGSAARLWSLTQKGVKRLEFFQRYPERISPPVTRNRTRRALQW